jgi:hypothetical protein
LPLIHLIYGRQPIIILALVAHMVEGCLQCGKLGVRGQVPPFLLLMNFLLLVNLFLLDKSIEKVQTNCVLLGSFLSWAAQNETTTTSKLDPDLVQRGGLPL